MKRTIAIVMCMVMVFALAACDSNSPSSSSNSSPAPTPAPTTTPEAATTPEPTAEPTVAPTPTPEPTAEPTEEPTPEPEEPAGGKTLVVYFSASGNTERVANAIATASGGDTFELVPTEPYSDADLDWTADGSRVNYEHDNEDARAIELVADTVDNWDEYDTVYIGYPIWWHIAAWPVNTFVKANDFTGKTVIPFCTSSSSDLGESGQLLADMAGTGDWQEGRRFSSGASDEEVAEWVNGLAG